MFFPSTIRTVAAWLALAVVLFGSGGAHLLHAIPGLGHDHASHCCHGHVVSSHDRSGHAHAGHKQHHHCHGVQHKSGDEQPKNCAGHCSSSGEPSADLGRESLAEDAPEFGILTTSHDCVLCEIIAILHQGAVSQDASVAQIERATDDVAAAYLAPHGRDLIGLPASRGPPVA